MPDFANSRRKLKIAIGAMQAADVRRLVTITGSMISDTGDGPMMRYVGKPITRRILRHTWWGWQFCSSRWWVRRIRGSCN